MKPSTKQQKLIDFARLNNNTLTKKDAMSLINDYYHNGDKYVGEIISRMIKIGWLIRVKNGIYKLGKGSKVVDIKNQTSLL